MRYIVIVCFKVVRNRAKSFARDNIRSEKQAKTLAKEFAYMPDVDHVVIRKVKKSKKTKWGYEDFDIDVYKVLDEHKHHMIKGMLSKDYKFPEGSPYLNPLVFGKSEFNL